MAKQVGPAQGKPTTTMAFEAAVIDWLPWARIPSWPGAHCAPRERPQTRLQSVLLRRLPPAVVKAVPVVLVVCYCPQVAASSPVRREAPTSAPHPRAPRPGGRSGPSLFPPTGCALRARVLAARPPGGSAGAGAPPLHPTQRRPPWLPLDGGVQTLVVEPSRFAAARLSAAGGMAWCSTSLSMLQIWSAWLMNGRR